MFQYQPTPTCLTMTELQQQTALTTTIVGMWFLLEAKMLVGMRKLALENELEASGTLPSLPWPKDGTCGMVIHPIMGLLTMMYPYYRIDDHPPILVYLWSTFWPWHILGITVKTWNYMSLFLRHSVILSQFIYSMIPHDSTGVSIVFCSTSQ